MSTNLERRCKGMHMHLDELGCLIDDFEESIVDRDRYLAALEKICTKDFGLLEGDSTWSVDQWHEYIYEVTAEIQVIAREVL